MTTATTPRTRQADTEALHERVRLAFCFWPRSALRRRFNLSRSELEDIVGRDVDEPERDTVSGY